MRKALLMGALALSCATVAAATEWTKTGATDEGGDMYVDLQSIHRDGATLQVSALVNFPGILPKAEGHTIGSTRLRFEFDCASSRSRLIHATAYSGRMESGDVIADTDANDPTLEPIQKGPLQDVLPLVCSK